MALGTALSALSSFGLAHADTLLGALGGIGSFAGNQISSAVASQRAWKYAVKQNTLQYLTDKRQKQEYYELMRESLARGGYNPLLALGSSVSGNSSGGSFPLSDSDQGDQAINSAMAMQNFKYQNDLLKKQVEGQDTDNKIKELERKKLDADLTTSPKNIITEIINGDKNGTLSKITNKYEKIKNKASAFGISLPPLPVTSAKSSNNLQQKIIKLHNNKPYVQKGVPRSVVKNFNNIEKKKVDNYIWHEGSAWNNSNYKVKFRYLDDSELR